MIKIRDICNISIEEKRASKEIGSSLEAALIINLDRKSLEIVKGIDLSELCITSLVEIKNSSQENIVVKQIKLKVKNVQYVGKLILNHVKDTKNNDYKKKFF